jgi:hypothetical protein
MTASRQDSIVGREADVIVTDPWEFMTEVGLEPLLGQVKSFEKSEGRFTRIVVDLVHPVTYRGKLIVSITAAPRHRDTPTADAVLNGVGMPANMEGLPTIDRAAETHPVPLLGEIRIRRHGTRVGTRSSSLYLINDDEPRQFARRLVRVLREVRVGDQGGLVVSIEPPD